MLFDSHGRPSGDWGYGAVRYDGRSMGILCRINRGKKLDEGDGAGAIRRANGECWRWCFSEGKGVTDFSTTPWHRFAVERKELNKQTIS